MRMPPVSVCHQVSTIGHLSFPAFRWYHLQASGLIGSPTLPRIRKLGISYLPGHSSPAAAIALIAVGLSVKLIDLPLLDHLPIPVRVRVSRNAFEHGRCGSIGQGTINDIGMPGNPANVSRTKIDALLVVVENVLVRNRRINHVAGGRVKNPFGFPVEPEV